MSGDITRLVNKMLTPLSRRLRLMVSRAVITAINDAGKIQSAQVKLLSGEIRDNVEVLQPYGLSSKPPGQPEGLYFSVGGDRDHGVMICIADRQYRVKAQKDGEICLYDDLGQKVHLTRDGIVIDGGGLPINIKNTPKVTIAANTKIRCETPLLETPGNLITRSDDEPLSLNELRDIFNRHTHNENMVMGGPTDKPNQVI